jgi:hypothetical protein
VIGIVRSGDDVFGAKLGPGSDEGLERLDVDLRVSSALTSISGLMRTNSMSITPTPVSAMAALVARIAAGSFMSG